MPERQVATLAEPPFYGEEGRASVIAAPANPGVDHLESDDGNQGRQGLGGPRIEMMPETMGILTSASAGMIKGHERQKTAARLHEPAHGRKERGRFENLLQGVVAQPDGEGLVREITRVSREFNAQGLDRAAEIGGGVVPASTKTGQSAQVPAEAAAVFEDGVIWRNPLTKPSGPRPADPRIGIGWQGAPVPVIGGGLGTLIGGESLIGRFHARIMCARRDAEKPFRRRFRFFRGGRRAHLARL